jgi:hypothetical protein
MVSSKEEKSNNTHFLEMGDILTGFAVPAAGLHGPWH